MKKFNYINAATLDEAVSLKKSGGAAVLAGGTDILNLLKAGAISQPPELLVNIKNIPGMDSIDSDAAGLKTGSLTKIAAIASSKIIKAKYPLLAEAAKSVASPAIRQMGTLAGNLCQEVQCWYFRRAFLTGNYFDCLRKGGRRCYAVTGDNRYHAILGAKGCFAVCPSDIAVALTALNATIVTGKRDIPAGDFYGVMGNMLGEDEIITAVRIPALDPGTRQAFIKFALRPTIDFSIVSVGAAVTVADGKVSASRIVIGAVAPMPYRASDAEEILRGKVIDETLAETAAEAAVKDAVPLSRNKYKVQIAKTLVKRAVSACGSD